MALAGLVAMGVMVGVFIWLQYRVTGGRTWSPLWTAFSLTAGAILFVVAGVTGYRLQGGVPFSRAASWTGSPIWGEVWAGVALVLIALPLWRVGWRRLRAGQVSGPRWRSEVDRCPDAGYDVGSLGGRCSWP
jgi:hypothetical protein